MTVSRWKVLVIIGRFTPMSAKDVGQKTSLEPEKVTRAVDGLVRRRYVIRRKGPEDKRRVILSLSPRGHEVFGESERIRYAIESEFLKVLDPDGLRIFYEILNKLEQQAIQIFAGKHSWLRILAQYRGTKTASGTKARRQQPSRHRVDLCLSVSAGRVRLRTEGKLIVDRKYSWHARRRVGGRLRTPCQGRAIEWIGGSRLPNRTRPRWQV
jgi:DNA-binding MarR family transcriptional regulator